MSGGTHRLSVGFNGRYVEVQCDSDVLAVKARERLGHLLASPRQRTGRVLQLVLSELTASWVELRDSTGRVACGSLEYVFHLARKWITTAFVSTHPDFLWLHAAAATRDHGGILLAGPAGAGKSTLAVQLIEHNAWRLLADDAVPLEMGSRTALPLPFSPDLRTARSALNGDPHAFLEQPKIVATVSPNQVALSPASIDVVVLPHYVSSRADSPVLERLSVVRTVQALAPQCLFPIQDRRRALGDVFRLAQSVPCYRLLYGDAAIAAAELTRRWSPESRKLRGFHQA
jgi:hypothetical protein